MRTREQELATAGARLVFVGTGLPAMAADFAATRAGPHLVLCDPQRRAFTAAGMKRSLGRTLHWRLLANLWRALRSGFRQGRLQGDPWQHGGVLVVDAAGRLRHQQVDAVVGDPLDVAAIVAAVRSG